MLPSSEQIAVAAYYRWERRRFEHGRHQHDWMTAEQELLFDANYEVLVRYRTDGVAGRFLGDEDDLRCRLCERTAPRAAFSEPRLVVPAALGGQALSTLEICDDCHAQYDESVGGDLDRFVRAVQLGSDWSSQAFVPVAAIKGFTWAALSMMPADEMQFFEDAVEWICNPDHDLDCQSIAGMECILHQVPEAPPFSWAALARRSDDDAEHPYLLAFFATGHTVYQIPLPLCIRDEELEGNWTIPRVCSPFGVGRGPLDSHHAVIPLSSSQPSRGTRSQLLRYQL